MRFGYYGRRPDESSWGTSRMDVEKLVERYVCAWNEQDVEGLLNLMHKGASFYDAFWMETCVGQDLAQYFRDSFEEENYWYEQIGGAIEVDNGVAFRYLTYERGKSKFGRALYNGAEVLILRDDKIITVSDYYCNPHEQAIEEIAKLASRRHGQTSFAMSGLGAGRLSSFRNRLSDVMDQDQIYLNPDLTLSQLANRIGCPIDHLPHVLNTAFGTNFHSYLDEHRVRFAKKMLLDDSDDPKYVVRVALQAGFQSLEIFNTTFRKTFGVTPVEFHRDRQRKVFPTDEPLLN